MPIEMPTIAMPLAIPIAIMVFIVAQRLFELGWASRNTKRLLALGGKEFSPKHYSVIVALHTSWILAIFVFIFLSPTVEVSSWYLASFGILTAFRAWILVTLGSFFTTKIVSLPGAPLRKTGPYRFIKHPNYALVVCEIVVVPLIFGFWQIALIWGIANVCLLAFRIHEEDLALKDRRVIQDHTFVP